MNENSKEKIVKYLKVVKYILSYLITFLLLTSIFTNIISFFFTKYDTVLKDFIIVILSSLVSLFLVKNYYEPNNF